MIRRTLLPAWEELTEILDFRQLVEQLIARTAAARRDDGDIAAITPPWRLRQRAPTGMPRGWPTHALHQAIARATHNARLVELSARIRREVSLGFDAEPYTPRGPAAGLHQHPELADAVIAGDADLAADLAAGHFSLTEDMLRELHARIRVRSGGECHAGSQGQ